MTLNVDEFDFSGSTGADVAKESSKGGDFARELEFLRLDASEKGVREGNDHAYVRLVNENGQKDWMGDPRTVPPTPWSLPWITVKQHYAPTKQKPPYSKKDQRWPEKMFAVCRKDKVFTKKYHDSCLVCDQGTKAIDRTWALAIERERVVEDGKVIGMRDKTREVFDHDADGKPIVLTDDGKGNKTYQMKTVPAWLVLNFGWKNFFSALNGQANYRGTCLDRDYVITRTGMENNDTSYSFVGVDPITGIDPDLAGALGLDANATPYDMGLIVGEVEGRNIPLAELLYPDMPDLRRIVAERVSDDYFGRWFKPGWLPEGFDPSTADHNGQGGAPTSAVSNGTQQGTQSGYQPPAQPKQPDAPVTPDAPAAATSTGPSSSVLDSLRKRVQGG